MASSSNSPCAGCKLLRRKCTPECVFAPYFPSDEPAKFASVHKVFGASNVAKILNDLSPGQREDAVKSLAYEAEARLRDPVYGCVGTISILHHRLEQIHMDIITAKQELASFMMDPSSANMIPNHQGMIQIQPQQNMLIRDHHHQQQQLYEAPRIDAPISTREQQELMNRNYGGQQLQQQEFVRYDNMVAYDQAAAMVMGGVEGVIQNQIAMASHGGGAMPPPPQSMALVGGGFENPYNNNNSNQILYQQPPQPPPVHDDDHKSSVEAHQRLLQRQQELTLQDDQQNMLKNDEECGGVGPLCQKS